MRLPPPPDPANPAFEGMAWGILISLVAFWLPLALWLAYR
jgi:hypothetical protein